MMNAVVDDDEIMDLLNASRFKNKYLFGVVADEDLAHISWNSQDHHSRKVLIQKSDILFSSNPSTRNWDLADRHNIEMAKSVLLASLVGLSHASMDQTHINMVNSVIRAVNAEINDIRVKMSATNAICDSVGSKRIQHSWG